MSDATTKVSHTADRIEHIAKASAKEKQVGNTRALLFQNLPGVREVRSAIGGVLGAIETTGDTLYRTLTLAARPQDLKKSGKIIRNGVKTVFGEKPQVATDGIKEYRQNLRAPKLTRDTTKQYHEPYLDETKFFDTHGTDLSLSPKKEDHRFKKIMKGIPFMAGKVAKIPLYASATIVGAATDTFRWMKGQKLRDLVTFDFTKTSRNKTSHAWNKLTSRAYSGNTSDAIEASEDKKEEVSDHKIEEVTKEKKSFRSRLRPFGKKKKEVEKVNTEDKKESIKDEKKEESKKEVDKPEQKEKTKEKEIDTIVTALLGSLESGALLVDQLEHAFATKDNNAIQKYSNDIVEKYETFKDDILTKDLKKEHKTHREKIQSTLQKIESGEYTLPAEVPKEEDKSEEKEDKSQKEEESDSKKERKKIDLKNITKEVIKENPDTIFLFGDNEERKGNGGQAEEMRGAGSNSLGIATLLGPDKPYTKDNIDQAKKAITKDIEKTIQYAKDNNIKNIIIPKDKDGNYSIGSGIVGLNKEKELKPIRDHLQTELTRVGHTIANL